MRIEVTVLVVVGAAEHEACLHLFLDYVGGIGHVVWMRAQVCCPAIVVRQFVRFRCDKSWVVGQIAALLDDGVPDAFELFLVTLVGQTFLAKVD